MKRLSLRALSIILVGGAVAAWLSDPSRTIDWIPLFVIGVVVSMVDARITGLEKRLGALEGGKSS